jgi:hypothetical protein
MTTTFSIPPSFDEFVSYLRWAGESSDLRVRFLSTRLAVELATIELVKRGTRSTILSQRITGVTPEGYEWETEERPARLCKVGESG